MCEEGISLGWNCHSATVSVSTGLRKKNKMDIKFNNINSKRVKYFKFISI